MRKTKFNYALDKILGIINILRIYFRPNKYFFLPKSGLTYSEDLLYTYNNADFLRDSLFIESYNLGKKTDNEHLLKNYDIRWRIHVLCWAANHAKHLDGDYIDCGVSTGIFARAIINFVNFNKLKKKYFLLDTFSGMDPKYSTEKEMQRSKVLAYKELGAYEQVKRTFVGFNVEIIKGPVPETLDRVKTNKFSFASIDMNSVTPEIAALEFVWARLVSGGIIVLDDYGYPGCLEQKDADDVFAKSKGVTILSLPTCQGLLIKP